MVRNHARKADARRRTEAGEGSHRISVHMSQPTPRIATGLTELDSLLNGGLRPGRLSVVAGRTAMGKSMLALSMVRHCAFHLQRPAQLVSLEMSHRELMTRLVAAETGLPTRKFLNRDLTDQDRQLVRAMGTDDRIRAAPLAFGGDSSSPTAADIRTDCEKFRRTHGQVALLVVDYLSLMRGAPAASRRAVNREQEVAQIIADLARLAADLNAAVVIVEQLTRATEFREDHRPRLADMTHAEALLEHAETVILLYRDAYYDQPPQTRRFDRAEEHYPAPALERAELHVPHHRRGETGVVGVGVDLSRCRFLDLSPVGLDPR